jgi:ribulose 1,5-bisphosphate synthetase/thiazole synthase
MSTATICIAKRTSTILWEGDVVVLGATYAGIDAATAAVRQGRAVCLVEPGMTLGTELSQYWDTRMPEGELGRRLGALCAEAGVPAGGRADIFTGTLAFDRIVEEAGVHCLARVTPVRALPDPDGRLVGVEGVGRSGRQAVLASCVIDALPGRTFARNAAGLPQRRADAVRRCLYVAGLDVSVPVIWEVDAALGIAADQVRVIPASWSGEAVVQFDVGNSSLRGMLELQRTTLAVASDLMAWLRANRPECAHATVVDVSPAAQPLFGRAATDWSALNGTGIVPLADDRRSSDPDLGDVFSQDCETPGLLPQLEHGPAVDRLTSHELSAAPEQDLPEIELPAVQAALHDPVDVLVAGYGTGGAVAALTAANEGVDVAVLDPAYVPGGIGTAGRIHSYYHGLSGGIQDSIDEVMTGKTAGIAEGVRGYHPVAKAAALTEALTLPNLLVFPGHTAVGVIRDGSAVTGVLSAAQDGYHVFPARVTIDSTGDGDVSAAAGAPMVLGREGDGFPQPYSYTPSLMRDGVLHHSNFDAGWVDPTDTLDFSRAHFEGRERLWERAPFTQQNHFCTLASVLGIRESRFLDGAPSLTFEDFMEGRTYPDSVCSAYAHYDNHAMDYAEESEWARRHVVMFGLWRYLCHGDIPFGALVPRGVDNLLMACRAVAVDHDLHQLVRMQRDIQVFGEICGIAAVTALHNGVRPADIDISELQRRLAGRGITPRPTEPAMDVSDEQLLETLREDNQNRGLAMWRLTTQDSIPDEVWARFFETETDPDARFAGAVAAALCGCALPSVVSLLSDCVTGRTDEPRLGVKSPPRYVVACLALVELKTAGIAETVGELLCEGSLQAPDLLLLLRALAHTSDPEAARRVVHEFLDVTAEETFAIPLWGVSGGSPTSFRPAIDLRAVRTLCELGEEPDAGRLGAYLDHEMLLVRRYARKIAGQYAAKSG